MSNDQHDNEVTDKAALAWATQTDMDDADIEELEAAGAIWDRTVAEQKPEWLRRGPGNEPTPYTIDMFLETIAKRERELVAAREALEVLSERFDKTLLALKSLAELGRMTTDLTERILKELTNEAGS